MAPLIINPQHWERLKLKLKRKYNHLSDNDLLFEPGNEEKLIANLAQRLNRNPDYVVFTLHKGLLNIDNNRL
ncbi:MAG: hypothetical protein EAY66_00760 [Sphingobacteriales bacterium]|jgi:hypothetical protein|nr:MAG: hypothetical protein EAY66_00760 [Sphingobacteriales bacterium]